MTRKNFISFWQVAIFFLGFFIYFFFSLNEFTFCISGQRFVIHIHNLFGNFKIICSQTTTQFLVWSFSSIVFDNVCIHITHTWTSEIPIQRNPFHFSSSSLHFFRGIIDPMIYNSDLHFTGEIFNHPFPSRENLIFINFFYFWYFFRYISSNL